MIFAADEICYYAATLMFSSFQRSRFSIAAIRATSRLCRQLLDTILLRHTIPHTPLLPLMLIAIAPMPCHYFAYDSAISRR